MKLSGKVSSFGGPDDRGVKHDEGLALYGRINQNLNLFLRAPHEGTAALARRLDPSKFYCAMRWDYSLTPKSLLRICSVKITFNNKSIYAAPCDWGPHERTERIIDVSPGVMSALGCTTDDTVDCQLIKPEYESIVA